jgi:CheY-like chemotaxis protein
MNLVVNARDAMPGGGTLELATANLAIGEVPPPGIPYYVHGGEFVRLTVSDTGTGMDETTLSHLFEPFFTTKPQGRGTGLGLSTVYGIIKQSDGYVWAESRPGGGTVFTILLPRANEDAAPAVPAPARVQLRGTGTVLLVEDDPAVRGMIHRVLDRSGYVVIEADDGEQALRLAAAHHGPIDLMLTDVVMPGMSGRELARHLAPLRPETRVLYASGYTDDAIAHHGVLEAGMNLIEKPFSPDALIRRVQELIGGGE